MANTKITSRVIADDAVTTAAIADDAITSAKLDTNIAVAGTLSVTGAITSDSTVTTLSNFNSTSGNDLRLNAGSANRDIFMQVNGTTHMTVQGSTGNVGIGTASPAAALHVNGDSIGNTFKLIANSSVSGSDATIFRPADNTMAFSTNGVERMRIDSSGRVTKPLQPAFRAQQSNVSGQNAGYKTVTFDDTSTGSFDIGGNFNNSNDRFTAPVAGRYQFDASVRCDGMNAYFRIIISKNGSISATTNLHSIYGVPSGNYESLQVGGVLDLAASDYVTVIIYAVSDTSWAFVNEGHFSGFLIG